MPNTIAPILAPLRESGSSFFTFSSSIADTALLFSNDNIRFAFSQFACLKLPKWANQTEQRLYRDNFDIGNPVNADPNLVMPKAYLQNYAENLLQYAEDNRTDNTFKNFSEAAFWKSLRWVSDPDQSADPKTGGLQLTEDDVYAKPDTTPGQKYVELVDDVTPGESYESVVKFIAPINMLNHVKTGGNEYMEIYCHVPRTAGKVIRPKFKPHDSIDFASGLLPDSGGDDWIVGREDDFNNNLNNVKAIYDNVGSKQYDVSSDLENLGIDFDEFENRENDAARYAEENFEFNAILLYYDIWDATDDTTRKRNLYGVLLLDRFETNGGTSVIPSLLKYYPDENQPGNAFAFRQNLKWSNYSNQVTSEITVGNELVGLDLYTEALARLTVVTDEYSKLSDQITKQQEDINQLKTIILQMS